MVQGYPASGVWSHPRLWFVVPFSIERLVPHRSAADCFFSRCFSWHCMRTGYFCSLFLLINEQGICESESLVPSILNVQLWLSDASWEELQLWHVAYGGSFLWIADCILQAGLVFYCTENRWKLFFAIPNTLSSFEPLLLSGDGALLSASWPWFVLCKSLPMVEIWRQCMWEFDGIWGISLLHLVNTAKWRTKNTRYHSLSSSMPNPTLLWASCRKLESSALDMVL